jgi:hypothetical protein
MRLHKAEKRMKGKHGENMKKGKWCKRTVLSLWMLGVLLLTGCPRRVTQEEQDAIKKRADESLTQALEENCGLKEGDYEILSGELTYLGYPHPIQTYQIRVGEETYNAVVNCEGYETYVNYNSEGFEEQLKNYVKEKISEGSELQSVDFEIASVVYWPAAVDYFDTMVKEWKLLPASVKPEGYDEYLKLCQKQSEIKMEVKAECFGEMDLESLDSTKLFGERVEKFSYGTLRKFTIDHYACSADASPKPTDLVETCVFVGDSSGQISTEKKISVYEYLTVGDSYLIRGVKKEGEQISATLEDGQIKILPGTDKYDLFTQETKEGLAIKNGITQDCTLDHAQRRTWKKSPKYDSWWYVDQVVGWYILPNEE